MHEVHVPVQDSWICLSTDRQLDFNEAYQSLEVLFIHLYIIMSGTINPQRFHSAWTTLVDHVTVRQVDDFVVSSMDNENH